MAFFLNRRALALSMAAALLLPAAGLAQQPQSFEQRFADLIAKAKAEGEVTWYQSFLEAPGKEFAAHFQQRFGIKVTHQFLSSGSLYERFRTETASGRNIADVFSSSDTSATLESMKLGYLSHYDTATRNDFPKGWVVEQNGATAYPTQRVHTAVAYNTQLVTPEQAKVLSTWRGLADPAFGDGGLGLNDPSRALSAVTPYYYWTRIKPEEYGHDFLVKLAAQKPVIYPGQTEQAARMGAGEFSVGLMVDIVAIQQYDLGAPVAFVYPSPTPVIIQYSALTKAPPHPNAARLLLEYLTSEDGLTRWKQYSGGFTGRPDLDARVKSKYASEPWYKEPKDFFIIDDWDKALKEYRAVVPEWQALFQKK